MEFITLLVVCGVAVWLRNTVRELKRRALSAEMGIAELRSRLDALQVRLNGTGWSPSARPAAESERPVTPERPEPEPESPSQPQEPQRPTAWQSAPPAASRSVPPVGPSAEPTASLPATGNLPSLEERLGTRWAVWVGALALALGGLLLVRYAIENDLIGPGLRITLGTLLAAALAIAGERMRRHERQLDLPILPAAHIPSALTSAATVVALGTAYAAHALYGFIGPGAAFTLLGAISLAALAGAALHGPALAGVGLLGAFAVPALVTSEVPNPWPVVVYLGIVAAAAYSLARLRDWLWLAGGVVAGAVVWTALLMMIDDRVAQDLLTAVMAHVLVQLGLAAYFLGIDPSAATPDADAQPEFVAHAALALLTFVGVVVLLGDSADPSRALSFALIAILILATTGLTAAPVAGGMLLGGLIMIAAMLQWKGVKLPAQELPYYLRQVGHGLILPERIQSFLTYSMFASLTIAGASAWRLRLGAALPAATAGLYAAAATLVPLIALVIAYLRVTQFDQSIHFAAAGIALAAAMAFGAEVFLRAEERERSTALRLGTGALAAAAIAALSLALTFGLERGYLTVAFALSALGAAFVAVRRDVPVIRYAVVALGALVLARVVWDPRIMGANVGTTPIVNWLLVGYGVPAVSFALAARLLRTRTDDISVKLSDALAVVFTALLIGFQIRHFLYAGDPMHSRSSHMEYGLQTASCLGLSYALARLDLGRGNVVFRWGSLLLGCLSAAIALIGLGFDENPLFTGARIVGQPWLSSLALAYLLPGAMAVLAARAARDVRPAWYVNMLAVLAVSMLLAFVTLEVRHMFQGAVISITRRTGGAEQWAYSVAWLALGLAFLAYGVLARSKPARLASAALVVLSVLKVFLFDLQELTGLWRALSFISLGIVLIGIGLVYQRLLFQPVRPGAGQRPSPPSPAPSEPTS